MRIIADLVMNHTSDQHPWFQESCLSPTNEKSDWYVWSDDDTRIRRTNHLRRHRGLELTWIQCASSTTGTASSIISPI